MKKYDVYYEIGYKVMPLGDVIAGSAKAAVTKRVKMGSLMVKGFSYASARRNGKLFAIPKSSKVKFGPLEKKLYGA
jgi:hypothetical protein